MSDYWQHQQGELGEQIAIEFLTMKGFKIEARNYRFRRNEIDLITRFQGTLVFVEVKLRRNDTFGHPETFVSDAQADRIVRTAEHYLQEVGWMDNIRFDIVAITRQPHLRIEHFEDAFG